MKNRNDDRTQKFARGRQEPKAKDTKAGLESGMQGFNSCHVEIKRTITTVHVRRHTRTTKQKKNQQTSTRRFKK